MYFVAANEPKDVIDLLENHLIQEGYKTEKDFFIIRAIFEFLMLKKYESAKCIQNHFWKSDEEDTPLHK